MDEDESWHALMLVTFVVVGVVVALIVWASVRALTSLRNADRAAYLDSRNPARWARKADTPPSDPPP